jgi:membrane protease YdiL (CAAX protease family)
LFDAQSQPEVRPPTILSSVLAILGMQEFGIVLSIPFLLTLGSAAAPFAMALGYALAAGLVCLVVNQYHRKHAVSLGDIAYIRPNDNTNTPRFGGSQSILIGLALGLLLGVLAIFYTQFLHSNTLRGWLPSVSETLMNSDQALKNSPNVFIAYCVLAVGVAPWAEEFLFRGLMFRAMLSQWGFWPASMLSTAFFTLLHPMMAWPMVFLLGATSAWLFLRTRTLLACIALHFAYNSLVVLAW